MKIFAQDGYAPADKLEAGLSTGVIQGAVLSARYRHPGRFAEKADGLLPHKGEILLDPEFYAYQFIGKPNAKLGSLEEWPCFTAPRRSALITGAGIGPVIRQALEEQAKFEHLTGFIAPNIHIDAADSIDAAIALNFIGQCKAIAAEAGWKGKPVFASLVIDRDALTTDAAFNDLLGALTALASPPDGFYVLVGSGSVDEEGRHSRSDLYHDHVIAGWMLVNYVLSINGFKVINGCSDLLSPLLGACGAYAVASGWTANLRQFTMGRYLKPKAQGGSAPLIRYVSNSLLARIRQTDYDDYRKVVGGVANALDSDKYYNNETTRTQEAIQTWDALGALCTKVSTGDISSDLMAFEARIERAGILWGEIADAGLSAGVEAQLERLTAMREGIRLFREWAELT